jgi:hypothetical protein
MFRSDQLFVYQMLQRRLLAAHHFTLLKQAIIANLLRISIF